MPWPEWGETDVALALARRRHEQLICKCGCGQWAPLAWDPDTDGWWEMCTEPPEAPICYAGAAVDEWRRDTKPDQIEPGVIPTVQLDPDFHKRQEVIP